MDNEVFSDIRKSVNEGNFRQKAKEVKGKLDAMKTGPIAEIWGTVQSLWARVADPNRSFMEKAIPLAALVYLVTPVDLIPDLIPLAGYLDDVAVLCWAAATALKR